MSQISQILSGERDYTRIRGGTGPLVYPAAHVYLYAGLYTLTDEGRDVRLAQWVFAGVYLAALGVVMVCYKRAGVGFYPAFGGWWFADLDLTRSRRMSSRC